MAKKLTDALVQKTSVPKGGPKIEWDAVATGLGLKLTPRGKRIWVLQLKFPGHAVQTRRTLGVYPALGLAAAREKAAIWYAQAKAGIDPVIEEAKAADVARRAAQLATQNSFAAVAEEFINRGLTGQRRGARVAHQIRRELLPVWGNRPIAQITRLDVIALIDKIVDRPAPSYAFNVFDATRALFNWAVERGHYGLETSPCDRIRPSKLIGTKTPRTRVLDDNELRALWSATSELGYPFAPLVRMLLLTGGRLSEVAGARWREFDLPAKTWTIPAARFKSNAQHVVPLTEEALVVLESIPRFTRGDFLFSTTDGAKPVNRFSKAKARIDARLGDGPAWVFHDLRRTVRTRLSQLHIAEPVAEMVIGHARKGLARVYDQHGYRDEIRAALSAWAGLLLSIVEPTPTAPDNVVKLLRA